MDLLFTSTAHGHTDGHNCTTQICKNTLLAGCNIILIVFHKQLQAPINYFVLRSPGPQRRKMLCAVDLANLLGVETPGHFGYFAVGPRIHLCVLSCLGQCVHILDGLKITASVWKLLNAVLSLTLSSLLSQINLSSILFTFIL